MGYNDSIFGMTSEFRYSAHIPKDADPTQPWTGDYNGYFVLKGEITKRVHERNVHFDFLPIEQGFQIVGRGSNEFGQFTLVGTLNSTTKEMTCVKEYEWIVLSIYW